MLSKQISGMTAQKLRLLLFGGIALMILVAVAGFLFMRQTLTSYAEEVRQSAATASLSTQNLASLQTLKTRLAEDADTVERTKNIVAESQHYAYQDQIIKDINTYANRAGVKIKGFSFTAGATGTAGAAPAAAATPGAAGATTVAGLTSTQVAITLETPVDYKNIMNFIHYIEQNLTKMQLSGISLTKDVQSGGVTPSALNIEVYTRS